MSAMESEDMYFLGSVVLIKLQNEPRATVIDGQQRLTTLTILLSVLRDLTTDTEKRIDRRTYIFQKANADRGTQDRFRVLLRPRDRAFLLKHVQEPGATNELPDTSALEGSQLRIIQNAVLLRSTLKQLDETQRDALVAFIVQRCYLVVISVPTADAARKIFTVLNARGLDLSPTDILKAELLDRAREGQEAALAERWEAVEEAVGRDELVELFGHLRMLYERDKPRTALEAGFKKHVAPFQGDADSFVSNVLEPLADAFLLLSDATAIKRQFGAEAAKTVGSLLRIDNKDWVAPCLLRLLLRTSDDKAQVAEFFGQLERLAYFLFVTRVGINERISRYAGVMNQIDPRGASREDTLALSETEQLDFITALDGPLYLKPRVCKPVLQRLDEALSTGGAVYDELVSIEHVLPQTVEEGSEWANRFPDPVHRNWWMHRIANLVFLTRRVNTRASNWPFSKKKQQYFSSADGSSPFIITQEVLRTEQWTPEYLAERQHRLLEKLAKVWMLDISKYLDSDRPEEAVSIGSRGFTATPLIEAKRQNVMAGFDKAFACGLTKVRGALYQNGASNARSICTISKRYTRGSLYWYGYHPNWDEFLSRASKAYLILGCMDKGTAYALEYEQFKRVLASLHRTPERHWHITLSEARDGMVMDVPNTSGIPLIEFRLNS